jgi:hypothetical protein
MFNNRFRSSSARSPFCAQIAIPQHRLAEMHGFYEQLAERALSLFFFVLGRCSVFDCGPAVQIMSYSQALIRSSLRSSLVLFFSVLSARARIERCCTSVRGRTKPQSCESPTGSSSPEWLRLKRSLTSRLRSRARVTLGHIASVFGIVLLGCVLGLNLESTRNLLPGFHLLIPKKVFIPRSRPCVGGPHARHNLFKGGYYNG